MKKVFLTLGVVAVGLVAMSFSSSDAEFVEKGSLEYADQAALGGSCTKNYRDFQSEFSRCSTVWKDDVKRIAQASALKLY